MKTKEGSINFSFMYYDLEGTPEEVEQGVVKYLKEYPSNAYMTRVEPTTPQDMAPPGDIRVRITRRMSCD